MTTREMLEEVARRGDPEEWLRVLLHESTRANNAEDRVEYWRSKAEGTPPLAAYEALQRADAALENALDFILTQTGPTEENAATFGWRKEAIVTGTRKVLEIVREAGRG